MHIDRQMVGLFFEIKRSLPLKTRNSLKIAETEVGYKLIALHAHTEDIRLKNLIERFLELAGQQWVSLVEPLNQQESCQYARKKQICDKILNQEHI